MSIINLKDKKTPQGWKLCNLPDFTHIEMGQSPPSTTYNKEKIGLPFFQGKAEFTELYPKIEKYCSKPNKIAKIGATLLTVRAPVGPTNLANIECCIGRGLAGIHPLGTVEPKFILLLMRSIEKGISNKGTGSTFTAINKTFLENLTFALPPLNEQKRIVAKIEELFSELDKGVESLKTARKQLKVYRQAVLKNVFSKFEYSSTIGDLFDFMGGGTPSKKESSYWNGDLPWASVKDVKGKYLLHTIDSITGKGLQNSSANLANPNDVILITRISPGKTVVSSIKTAINQDLKIINPIIEAEPLFIHYLFKSLEKEVIKLSSGTTVLGINLNNLRSIQVPFLSIIEQQKIVEEIESKFSVIDQIEKDIEANLQKSESLRQSILKKAFSGQLVAQDPNDEPAGVLLERIRVEKAAQKPKQQKTKSRRKIA